MSIERTNGVNDPVVKQSGLDTALAGVSNVWEVLSKTDISASVAYVDVNYDFTDTNYIQYKIILNNLVLDNNSPLKILFKDNGSADSSSNYETSYTTYSTGNAPSTSYGVGDTSIAGFNLRTSIPTSGEIVVGARLQQYPTISYDIGNAGTDYSERTLLYGAIMGGVIETFDGLRICANAGNLTSGSFTLIGLKA